MKKSILAVACLAVAFTLCSCSVTRPYIATSNPVGNKVGEASYSKVFWLGPPSADIGIEKAAKNGGITKISHVDVNKKTLLFGLYSKTTTRVYGE